MFLKLNKCSLVSCLKQTIASHRCLHLYKACSNPIKNVSPFEKNASFLKKMQLKIGIGGYSFPRWRMQESSGYLYESSTDGVKFENFLIHCKMPDTFMSWLLVTQLHVWLVMVRAMAEGAEGEYVRNQMVAIMWEDISERLKQLTFIPMKQRKKFLDDFNQQFQAAILSYDEGLLTDDKTLAAAVWRIFFLFECDDPILLEMLVKYIREQNDHLASFDREKILNDGKFKWKHFHPLYP